MHQVQQVPRPVSRLQVDAFFGVVLFNGPGHGCEMDVGKAMSMPAPFTIHS
jgi:hypothetical protein